MRLKPKDTSSNDKQLDFFSFFNFEKEKSHIDIIKEPLSYNQTTEFDNSSVSTNYNLQSDSDYSSIVAHGQLHTNNKFIPDDAIIHYIPRATENDYLFRIPEYDAELGAAVFKWNADSVMTIYIAAMEESFENLRLMVQQKTLFSVNEDGSLVVNPMLIAETRWYMSELFELACAANGIDPIEFRQHLRDFLYNETHSYREMKAKSALYKSDPLMVFHDCSDGTDWETFFAPDYFHCTRKLALKWTDADLVTLFTKAFTDTMDLFETLVVCGRITTADIKGRVQVNPVFESEFEWILSDVFEIIGRHLGYDVASVRKQIAAVCQVKFH